MNKSDVVAVEPVIALAKAAGEVILEVYEKEYEIIQKADGSPVTTAYQIGRAHV